MLRAAALLLLDLGLLAFLVWQNEIFLAQIIVLTQLSTALVLLPFLLRGELQLKLPSTYFANALVLLALSGLFSPFFFVSKSYWSVNSEWGDEARKLLFGYGDLLLILAGAFAIFCLLAALIRREGAAHD